MKTIYQFEIKEQRITHTFIDIFGDDPVETKVNITYNIVFTAPDGKRLVKYGFETEAEAQAAIQTHDWEAEENKIRWHEEQTRIRQEAYRLKRERINAQRRAKRKK